MRRIHKLFSKILALTLCFSLMASTAMASPWKWTAPKQNKKAQTQRVVVLHDIQGHWAEAAMAKMNMKKVINGYEDATFQPNKPITRLETVVMLVRLIGAEDEAKQTTTIPAVFKNGKQIPDWAKGYVAVAVQKGILAGDDLLDFRPNQAAQRYEIAVMSLRALDLSEQAQIQARENLSFIDAKDVPDWARGYIVLIAKKHVMIGNPDRTFQPKKPITRAEMATMMERMENLLKNQFDAEEVKGTLTAVDADDKEITVKKTDGSTQTMKVAPEAFIFIEKSKATLAKLAVGSRVDVLTNDEGTAVYIRAYKPEAVEVSDTDLIRGTIKTVVGISGSTSMTIEVGGAEITLDVDDEATVKLDGKTADLDDLKAGQAVEVKVADKQVVAIEAESQNVDVTGTVTAVGTNSIAIKVGDTALVYSVATNAVIKRDGETVKLSSLEAGDAVELEVKDGVALKITAESDADVDEDEDEDEAEGTFVSATTGTITIELVNGTEKTYSVRADANIERDGDDVDLDELEAGDKIELELEDGVVVDIQAEAEEVDETEGTVKAIATGTITIELSNDTDKTYAIRADAQFKEDGQTIDFDDIKVGDEVDLTLTDNIVTLIEVE